MKIIKIINNNNTKINKDKDKRIWGAETSLEFLGESAAESRPVRTFLSLLIKS